MKNRLSKEMKKKEKKKIQTLLIKSVANGCVSTNSCLTLNIALKQPDPIVVVFDKIIVNSTT